MQQSMPKREQVREERGQRSNGLKRGLRIWQICGTRSLEKLVRQGNPIAVAIIAKGGQFSECSVDSLKQQVKGGLAKGYLAKLRASQPADRDVVSKRDQPERSQTLPLRQSSDQANVHPSDEAPIQRRAVLRCRAAGRQVY